MRCLHKLNLWNRFIHFLNVFIILLIDFRDREGKGERQKHQFVVPLIYVLILVCALIRD